MRCPNQDVHSGSYWNYPDMTRLYVRKTEDGKRKWIGVGYLCDGGTPTRSSYWKPQEGCGLVVWDEKAADSDDD